MILIWGKKKQESSYSTKRSTMQCYGVSEVKGIAKIIIIMSINVFRHERDEI